MILMLLVELMEVLSNLKVLLTILMGLQITVMDNGRTDMEVEIVF